MTKRKIVFVLVPIRAELMEDGRIGTTRLPNMDFVQARMEAGHVLPELESLRILAAECVECATVCAENRAYYWRALYTNRKLAGLYTDPEKEYLRMHYMYERERDEAQALLLRIRELENV